MVSTKLEVAHLLAVAQVGGVRRLAHALLAAGDHDRGVAGGDLLGGQGATARRPEPQSWLRLQAGLSTGMPALTEAWRAGPWPCAGRQHLAHDHFVDVGRREPARSRRPVMAICAQFMRGQAGKGRR